MSVKAVRIDLASALVNGDVRFRGLNNRHTLECLQAWDFRKDERPRYALVVIDPVIVRPCRPVNPLRREIRFLKRETSALVR